MLLERYELSFESRASGRRHYTAGMHACRVGDDVMMHLMLYGAVFIPVHNGSWLQVCGMYAYIGLCQCSGSMTNATRNTIARPCGTCGHARIYLSSAAG